MRRNKTVSRVACLAVAAVFVLLAAGDFPARASNPHGAFYSSDNNRIFWFVHFSDIHIGARDSQDSDNLEWMVTEGKNVIAPSFMVASGDLTDSTDGNWFGLPNGPYQAEWDEYKSILAQGGIDASFYYDLPGNHDAYNDQYFAYYRANSIQGQATGGTQISWTREFPFGKYHFLGVNSADNTGDPFSLSWPWGDYAGLDATELAFIDARLAENADAQLTMVFGHHPVTDTGVSGDTWLYYGAGEFVTDLDAHAASLYGYGHTHRWSDVLFAGDSYTGFTSGDGFRYLNIASLGKSSSFHYDIVAIDCNAVSVTSANVGQWPVVLITAPVSAALDETDNPYSYPVPAEAANPIRALVFDAAQVTAVRFQVDGAGDWFAMTRVAGNERLWEGTWDASSLQAGLHTLTVEAAGTATRSQTITVNVTGGTTPNAPPVALDDAYATDQDAGLSVAAPGVLGNDSDADGDALTAAMGASPRQGSVALNADGSFSYSPAAGFSGTDSFTYTASDGRDASGPAIVTIMVRPLGPDTVHILTASYNAKPKKLHVEATSSAQPDSALTVAGYGAMSWVAAEGKYVFDARVASPPGDYLTVNSSRGGSDTFYFGAASNSAPVAYAQSVTVMKDTAKAIALGATDPDGDPLAFAVVAGPSHGTLTGTAPDLTYTPAAGYTGADSFTFKANDGKLDSNVATVSISVTEASGVDVVAIVSAEYKAKAKMLTVEATSTWQPDAVLTVAGYGTMTFNATSQTYVLSQKLKTAPGATVTVNSDKGGSATAAVVVK